jgi:16S rRNA pseudouridine516 synthase
MERIDKIIASQTEFSRSEVKKLILQRKVTVDGNVISKSDVKVDEENSVIEVDGKKLNVRKYIYIMLNKPKGYVSATEDKNDPTVLDLLPDKYLGKGLFPAGRLDKNTTGLMIITNDGVLAHNILAPKKHIKKLYDVTLDIPTTDEMVKSFERGIELNDGQCKSAIMQITGEYTAIVTITEGRYHQIKRMFGCCGAKVIELRRLKMGNLELPEDLKEGESRELTDSELLKLQEL